MSKIKMSRLLQQLMDKAMTMGANRSNAFTAERFLTAIFDLSKMDAHIIDPEWEAVWAMVDMAVADKKKAEEQLLLYVNQDQSLSFLDDLYMKNKLQEAADLAAAEKAPVLTADVLLSCVIKNPSDTIRSVLAEKKPAGETQVDLSNLMEKMESILSLRREMTEEEPATETQQTPPVTEKKKDSNNVRGDMASLVSEVKRIGASLRDSVYGQDNAINVFVTGYFQARMLSMMDKTRKRPRATFLFAGPPGVGKTFLAEKAAEALKLPFKRFDMSEYCDKEAAIEFCGSDSVYKNSKQGNFTAFVSENPECVLLFDEIEKAHISIIHLFLQILDAGRIRDNQTDKELSLKDAIIIFTTNAGRQIYEESESGDLSTVSRKVIIRALQKDINPQTNAPYFPGAICSRFASGNVVMFNHMDAHNLHAIARKEILRHAENLKQETGICHRIDDRVYTALLLSEGGSADARTVRSRAETFFNDELYELLRLVASDKVHTGIESIEKISMDVDLSHTSDEIRELFESDRDPQVLVFADQETVSTCAANAPAFDILGVQTREDAVAAIKARDIDFILLDVKYGATADVSVSLNIEDVETPVRDFLKGLQEQRSGIPVYLIEENEKALSEEEKISFLRQGVRGILSVTGEEKALAEQFADISARLHQQASMVKLAKENKLISFETAQTISADGKNAHIKLFDFRLCVAVDSEDAGNVVSSVSRPNVRFADVIGAREAKKELDYFVAYLKNPKKYMGTGVKPPKGVLLYGPPGTGKTMLAKAMACEAGVTFLSAEGNQFLKKYVGEGSEAVHALFKTARKYAPSILFVDEIDAIAKERRGGTEGAGSEETLTAFLTEMDGFVSDPSKPVFVLAATNFDVQPGHAKSLDPALMRRFDRSVYIDLPERADRIRFLNKRIAGNAALAVSQQLIENIAMRATGMSLASLDSVVELALRSAIREGSTKVTDTIFEEAFETFNSGEVKKWDVEQLERVARHEAGHALLCWLGGETPSYLTIVARGDHGGYMQHAEQEGKAIYTKAELMARIRTSLGGRAAEIVYYGPEEGISTGASGDLTSATRIARQIVCAYGMDEAVGLAVSDSTAGMPDDVRAAVNRILQENMAGAIRLISENKDKIDALVAELLARNNLTGQEIHQILSK